MACLYIFGSNDSELVAVDRNPKSYGVKIRRCWSDAKRVWGLAGNFACEQVTSLWSGAEFIDVLEQVAKLLKDKGALEKIKIERENNKFLLGWEKSCVSSKKW